MNEITIESGVELPSWFQDRSRVRVRKVISEMKVGDSILVDISLIEVFRVESGRYNVGLLMDPMGEQCRMWRIV